MGRAPILLDLFCGAGGASRGYADAGFRVVGVDIKPQARYPFEFHQADALEFGLDGFDVVHASPPCQKYHLELRGQNGGRYPDLLEAVRNRLQASGVRWVIESVNGAPLVPGMTVMLCGSMFGLDVRRHRYFESNVGLLVPACNHESQAPRFPPWRKGRALSRTVNVTGHGRYKGDTVALWRSAMGIDWMTRKELAQAIPPAYTRFIGWQLAAFLDRLCSLEAHE